MATYNAVYVPAATNLAASATWDVAVAPSAPWDAGSTVTFSAGGKVTFSSPNALTSVNLAGFFVGPGCSCPIGEPGAPVLIYCNNSTGIVDYAGAAPTNYLAGGSTPTWKIFWCRPVGNSLVVASSVDIATTVWVGSGAARFPSTTTVPDVYVTGSGQVDLQTHATDTMGNSFLSGNASMRISRPMGASKRIIVGPGTTLTIDVTTNTAGVIAADNFVGEVIMAGGTCIVINGNVTFYGCAGLIDTGQLQRAATMTVNPGSPDLTIRKGQYATITQTALGAGAVIVPV